MTELTDPGTAPPGERAPTRPNPPGTLRRTPSFRRIRGQRGSIAGKFIAILVGALAIAVVVYVVVATLP